MATISVRDDGNSRWKRNAKNNEDRKEQGKSEARVKGSELNDFVVHLSSVFSS